MKTILENLVFINEENKSKEIQGKNVLSFTKFVLGVSVRGFLAWGGFLLIPEENEKLARATCTKLTYTDMKTTI